ncbi:30S ribosomal protein S4 [Candidatus Kaiserbacteria bacterium]|nr:MAG: 30S ribosomal protein S4 [Candidatus Kaiserbacteria bacterium]PCI90487.1 MAG: 30S ribosomal protein S4 [Candidatus Kaiserbacteria bacterium]
MLSKPKYKICKRLGSGVYEKCQTEKFALSEARVKKTYKRRRNISDFGRQLLEKQKVRFAYGITEKQFRKYVATATSTRDPASELFKGLETRLDNTVYRLGFAPTRRAARQMVSHGHIVINGRKMNVPSHSVKTDDVITIRESSMTKPLFEGNKETIASHSAPKWLTVDSKKLTASVKAYPEFVASDTFFDLPAVFEFYSR